MDRRTRALALFALVAFVVGGCASYMPLIELTGGSSAEATPAPTIPIDTVSAGARFTLGVGESAHVDGGLAITFDSVSEDSRCPSDVQCVWEGNAAVAVEVRASGETPATLSLNTNPALGAEATYVGYSIELLALAPYPRTTLERNEHYLATLTVTVSKEPTS
jgi:hypothetical protein